MIGQRLSPILVEIEKTLREFEANNDVKPGYTIEGFRAATKIFMSVLIDKIWELQSDKKMSIENKIKIIEKVVKDIKKLIKVYTDIDTEKLF